MVSYRVIKFRSFRVSRLKGVRIDIKIRKSEEKNILFLMGLFITNFGGGSEFWT